MREILFRGKRKDNSEWVYGVPIEKYDKTYIVNVIQSFVHTAYNQESVFDFLTRTYEVIPETVGQYTGITDKNGKEIYEGDILKFQMYIKDTEQNYKNIFTHIDEVIYRDVAFRLKDNSCAMCVRDDIDTLEVIGNIHDIPELLRRT